MWRLTEKFALQFDSRWKNADSKELLYGTAAAIMLSLIKHSASNWLNFVRTAKARSKIKQALGIEIEPRREKAIVEKSEELLALVHIDSKKYAGKQAMLKFSGCCSPTLKKPIVGVLTKDKKIGVHAEDCVHARSLDPKKLVTLQWTKPAHVLKKFRVYLPDEDPAVLVGLLDLLVKHNVVVQSVNTRIKKKSVVVTLKIQLRQDEDVAQVVSTIRNLEHVHDVAVA